MLLLPGSATAAYRAPAAMPCPVLRSATQESEREVRWSALSKASACALPILCRGRRPASEQTAVQTAPGPARSAWRPANHCWCQHRLPAENQAAPSSSPRCACAAERTLTPPNARFPPLLTIQHYGQVALVPVVLSEVLLGVQFIYHLHPRTRWEGLGVPEAGKRGGRGVGGAAQRWVGPGAQEQEARQQPTSWPGARGNSNSVHSPHGPG